MQITKTVTLCDSCAPDEREATQSVMLNSLRYDLCDACYAALEKALVFLRTKVKVELTDLRVEVATTDAGVIENTPSGTG